MTAGRMLKDIHPAAFISAKSASSSGGRDAFAGQSEVLRAAGHLGHWLSGSMCQATNMMAPDLLQLASF